MRTRTAISFALLVAGIVVFGAAMVLTTIQSLERVGISPTISKDCIYYSISGGYLNYPSPSRLKQIATGDRAAAVREIAAFAKEFTKSDDFRKRYIEYRENQKPEPPEKPKPMAQQRAELKAQMQQSIKETESNMKSLSADQRPILQQTVDMLKQQVKEYDNPDNPMFSKDMENMQKQMYDMTVEEYKKKLAEWEQKYPADPKPMIRAWLTKFLEETKEVDFSAQLKDGQYGKKVFVNPAYEGKSSNWKMAYRAGKAVVEAGRSEARRWLEELK
ncbi:MAG: hypothetical protein KF749_07995 [Bacteroidetes bacterium]|nr:hypothetical protein [Bacteroidota bacterium]MCW5894918.1 hypothetical protein [Bacteroidota bacterium]